MTKGLSPLGILVNRRDPQKVAKMKVIAVTVGGVRHFEAWKLSYNIIHNYVCKQSSTCQCWYSSWLHLTSADVLICIMTAHAWVWKLFFYCAICMHNRLEKLPTFCMLSLQSHEKRNLCVSVRSHICDHQPWPPSVFISGSIHNASHS